MNTILTDIVYSANYYKFRKELFKNINNLLENHYAFRDKFKLISSNDLTETPMLFLSLEQLINNKLKDFR